MMQFVFLKFSWGFCFFSKPKLRLFTCTSCFLQLTLSHQSIGIAFPNDIETHGFNPYRGNRWLLVVFFVIWFWCLFPCSYLPSSYSFSLELTCLFGLIGWLEHGVICKVQCQLLSAFGNLILLLQFVRCFLVFILHIPMWAPKEVHIIFCQIWCCEILHLNTIVICHHNKEENPVPFGQICKWCCPFGSPFRDLVNFHMRLMILDTQTNRPKLTIIKDPCTAFHSNDEAATNKPKERADERGDKLSILHGDGTSV